MPGKLLQLIVVVYLIAILGLDVAWSRDSDSLRITIPRRSQLTPVQRLNREGVDAVRKHDYEKAGALFYKAYLYDPADPFTLNNLGYISELQGQLERAQKFYDMASKQGSNAEIDRSNAKGLQGRPMTAALESLQDLPMQVNRMNVDAMSLLARGRGLEATALLRKALSLDAQNPFTLNNLGVAGETIGDYDSALKYYGMAAALRSSEPVVVTENQSWRGKPVSKMADASAKRLEARLRRMDPAESPVIMLTMRGVTAANQNDWSEAKQDFLKAYSLDSASAFTLNNRGYVAERDGDLETAQFFYGKARRADNSTARVGLATQSSAEGQNLVVVAADSNRKVDSALDRYKQDRRRQEGPIELIPRGPVGDSQDPQVPPENQSPSGAPAALPIPETQPH